MLPQLTKILASSLGGNSKTTLMVRPPVIVNPSRAVSGALNRQRSTTAFGAPWPCLALCDSIRCSMALHATEHWLFNSNGAPQPILLPEATFRPHLLQVALSPAGDSFLESISTLRLAHPLAL